MFTVTALGHQGWLIGGGRTHVLVDPVLGAHFSRMRTSGAEVWPPRSLDLREFPPIDAVLVTHEHPDHLDFATLQLLDRRTPVFVSAHGSLAARKVIEGLGLDVRVLRPGREVEIGDLSVVPFAPFDVGEEGSNELDVLPLLLRDHATHGSFFTAVDLPTSTRWAEAVRAHVDRPGVWAAANASFDRSVSFEWIRRVEDPCEEAARQLADAYASTFAGWGDPELVMVTDNGLSLGKDLAHLNAHVFEVDTEALVERLAAKHPGHAFRAARAGTTAILRDGELVELRDRTPFLSLAPRDRWPSRGGAPLSSIAFAPGCGRRSLGDDLPHLERALADFARFLFARATFRGLFRLPFGALEPTFALQLDDDDGALVFAFRASDASFVRVACDDPRAHYVAGMQAWATDLLAALTLAIPADDLFHFGRKRLWNAAHEIFRCDLDTEVELYAHALRNPDAYERLYRESAETEASPTLRAPEPYDPAPRSAIRREPKVRASAQKAQSPELVDAISRGSEGQWSLAESERRDGVLRLLLALGGARLTLDVAPLARMPRHYRVVDDLAFTYGGTIEADVRSVLDRVIDELAAVISARAR